MATVQQSGSFSSWTEHARHSLGMARNVAAKAGLRPGNKMTDLDMGVLVIEGLETARRAALKRDAALGETPG